MSTALVDLERLQQLCRAGFANSFLDNALRRIVDRQITRDETDLVRISDELVRFEHQYQMTSEEFWRLYSSGEMTDSADFMEWSTFLKMRQRITSRLRILRGDGARE